MKGKKSGATIVDYGIIVRAIRSHMERKPELGRNFVPLPIFTIKRAQIPNKNQPRVLSRLGVTHDELKKLLMLQELVT